MNDDDAKTLFHAACILDRLQATGAVPRHAEDAAEKAEAGLADLLDLLSGHTPRDVLWVSSPAERLRFSH